MSKNFQLTVPNYEGGSGNPPLTYLRLGAAFPTSGAGLTETQRGDDHVKPGAAGSSFSSFKADSAPWADPKASNPTFGRSFYEDDAVTVATVAHNQAQATSNKLLSRGGVREHTDGNRISTTRGDCVEVVGGNYRLIVLGRVDPSDTSVSVSTWESSGGHNHDSTSTPGEVISISWSTTDSGTWEVTEKTEKGEVHSSYTGRYEEVFSGPSKIEYTGYGGPLADPTDPKSTASGTAKKPDITETTYARQVSSTLHATSVDEKVHVTGNMTESSDIKAAAGTHHSFLDVTGSRGCTSTVGTKAHPIGNFSERTNAGITVSFERFGHKIDNYAGKWTNNISLCAANVEVGVGTSLNLHYDRFLTSVNLAGVFKTGYSLLSASSTVGPVIDLKMVDGKAVELDASLELDLAKAIIDFVWKKKIAAAKMDLFVAQIEQIVRKCFS